MVNTVVLGFARTGEEKVQTIKSVYNGRSESYSGKHNPKVVGSSPTPATIKAVTGFPGGGFLFCGMTDTKLKGDIAEQAALLKALELGWGVLQPVGDRLPYDLVFDIQGCLVKIQVKCAWFDQAKNNWVVDNRRTKTNRRVMKRSNYQAGDFDFALLYIPPLRIFYVLPVEIFISYGSEIHLVEDDKRQRKPASAEYRERWDVMELFSKT